MDKQFINIDDLVRQRLSGSEEEERSGAWRNMRELLDNEMPQKRVGFFNWRRMFSGMAVLLLLGSISLGGYELSSSVRGTGTQGSATAGKNAVTPVMRAKSSSSTGTSDKRDNQSVANSIASKGQPTSSAGQVGIPAGNGVGSTGSTIVANENDATNSGIAATNTQPGSPIAHNNNSHKNTNNANHNTSTNKEYSNGSAIAANTVKHSAVNQTVAENTGETHNALAAVSHNVPGTGTGLAHNQHGHGTGADLTGHVTGKRTHNTGNRSGHTGETIASLPLAASSNGSRIAGNSTMAVNGSTTTGIAKTTARNGNTGETSTTSSPVSSDNGATSDMNSVATAGLLKTEKAHKLPASKLNARNTLATNTRVAAILSKAAAAKNAAKHGNVRTKPNTAATALTGIAKNNSVADLPVSSSTPAAASIAAKTSGIATGTARVTGSKLHPAGTSSSVPVAAHKLTTGIAAVAKHGSEPVTDDAGSAAEQDNSKKIEKLTLVYSEKYYKTTGDDGYFKMDTIALLRSSSPDPAAKTAAKPKSGVTGNSTSAVAAAPTHGKAKTSAANRNAAAAEEASSEEPVANAASSEPAATASKETSSASNTSEETAPNAAPAKPKELNAAKKSGGSQTMEKLNEKFNDLKYHVKGVQFAPGLTAGVNSTFFSPESFKGFQFGFTGEFVFSDAVSIMSELKYFHRINNNYSLEDNYYKYTQVGGQYRKDLQMNSYSFSTLHSVELPLSVRYTAGKFTFFAGGNFLYTFSINTGAVSVPGPVTPAPVYVSAIGDDNAPKLNDQDFASRFGIGYLFGASFQISPNLSLDVRNAQTLWDNSGSQGSKYVSGQLYRNPSLQVSIGYRFGGKRSSED